MQVQKYKLGEAVFTRLVNDPFEYFYSKATGVHLNEKPLIIFGATPLIESEVEMLDENPGDIFDQISNLETSMFDVTKLTIYLARVGKAINALQKGVK